MHCTCKNTSVKPDRSSWMTRSENPCEGNRSTSLLDVTVPSEPNRDLPLQISTTLQRKLQNCKIAKWRHGGSWVEPLPMTEKDWAGTWIERPQSISLCNRCVFVGWRHLKHTPSHCWNSDWKPLLKIRLKTKLRLEPQANPCLISENTKVEVLHLFRCSTHTPRCRGAFKAPTNEMKVKMREMEMKWRWRWSDNYLTGTQEGERKKEKGRRKHQHQHT